MLLTKAARYQLFLIHIQKKKKKDTTQHMVSTVHSGLE